MTTTFIMFSYAILVLLVAVFSRHVGQSKRDFHTASGSIGVLPSAISIAASWVWAPAIFVSTLKSYQLGLAGLFWFTVPNVLAILIFCWLAPKFRRQVGQGFTFLDWVDARSDHKFLKSMYRVPIYWYQFMAIVVQLLVGSMFISKITGFSQDLTMILMLLLCGVYSGLGGIRASINTDVLQYSFLITCSVFILSFFLFKNPNDTLTNVDFGVVLSGLFDVEVALYFGIITSLGLIGGAMIDQQLWQRAMITESKNVRKSFLLGGILFSFVPLTMGALGILASFQPGMEASLSQGFGAEFAGFILARDNLGSWAQALFLLMILSGLMSTLDSGICAFSAIQDDQNEKRNPLKTGFNITFLCLIAFLATKFFFSNIGLDRVWWILNGVSFIFIGPTLLLMKKSKSERKDQLLFMASILGVLPLVVYVYANAVGNDSLALISGLSAVAVPVIVYWSSSMGARMMPLKKAEGI